MSFLGSQPLGPVSPVVLVTIPIHMPQAYVAMSQTTSHYQSPAHKSQLSCLPPMNWIATLRRNAIEGRRRGSRADRQSGREDNRATGLAPGAEQPQAEAAQGKRHASASRADAWRCGLQQTLLRARRGIRLPPGRRLARAGCGKVQAG